MKRQALVLLLVLLTLLCGCGGKQEAAETAAPTETVQSAETEAMAPETALEESNPETEAVPEEWISHEETPETPTRPAQAAEEQSVPEVITPTEGEVDREYQPDPHENETPLAIG